MPKVGSGGGKRKLCHKRVDSGALKQSLISAEPGQRQGGAHSGSLGGQCLPHLSAPRSQCHWEFTDGDKKASQL